jgi:hypothetical protein
LKELRKTNLKDFYRLTEQVIGRWIDSDARDRGKSKWKDSVLQNVECGKGNAPGGHTTRCGVLVSLLYSLWSRLPDSLCSAPVPRDAQKDQCPPHVATRGRGRA